MIMQSCWIFLYPSPTSEVVCSKLLSGYFVAVWTICLESKTMFGTCYLKEQIVWCWLWLSCKILCCWVQSNAPYMWCYQFDIFVSCLVSYLTFILKLYMSFVCGCTYLLVGFTFVCTYAILCFTIASFEYSGETYTSTAVSRRGVPDCFCWFSLKFSFVWGMYSC